MTVDDLLNYDPGAAGLPLPPRGKHSFGFVTVDEAGRLPLPEAARQLFAIGPGDRLLLLGEEGNGLALLREQDFEAMLRGMRGGEFGFRSELCELPKPPSAACPSAPGCAVRKTPCNSCLTVVS